MRLSFLVFCVALILTLVSCSFPSDYASPSVAFTTSPSSGVAPLDVLFTVTPDALAAAPADAAFCWDFGDGAGGKGAAATHTYEFDGQYTVRASLQSPDGVLATAEAAISVDLGGKGKDEAGTVDASAVLGTLGVDNWDPADNSRSGATALTPSDTEQSHGPHTLGPGDPSDFFKFRLTSSSTYTFNTTGGTGDNFGRLYDANGTQVAANDDGGGNYQFSLSYTPSSTGDFYLEVHPYGRSETIRCSYSLKYRGPSGGNGGIGHGHDADSAQALPLGVPVSGSVERAGVVDWFRLDVQAGCTYTLSTSLGTLSDSVLSARVRASGQVSTVGENDDAGGTLASSLQWTLVRPATLFICVTGYGDHSGTYTVQATRSCPGPDTSISLAYLADITATTNWSGGTLIVQVYDMVGNVCFQTDATDMSMPISVLLPGAGVYEAAAAASWEEVCVGMPSDSEAFVVSLQHRRASIALEVLAPCIPPPDIFY